MRALYINLERSPERRKWIEQQTASLGLALERIAAVDGAALEEVLPPNLSFGALACFHSHRNAWDMVAKGDDRYVAIFEDDVHMSPDLPRFLGDTSWIPEDADIVHIGRSRERCIVLNDPRKAMDRKLYLTVTENSGTEAYVISRNCAAHMLSAFVVIDKEFDQILFNDNAFALTIYKLVPSLCIQDQFVETPRFEGQIARRPTKKDTSFQFYREVSRLAGKLSRTLVKALRLRASLRIRVEFR